MSTLLRWFIKINQEHNKICLFFDMCRLRPYDSLINGSILYSNRADINTGGRGTGQNILRAFLGRNHVSNQAFFFGRNEAIHD